MAVIFITSGTSWTVPSDWNSASNTIEGIGGGGAGGGGGGNPDAGGGGGGAYAKAVNVALTPGAVINIQIGQGGTGVSNANGSAGTDTIFNTGSPVVVAKGGAGGSPNASSGAAGGVASSCTPTTGAASGGAGGSFAVNAGWGGAGGGGAGGPHGTGAVGGGNGQPAGTRAGSGGGASDGGSAGVTDAGSGTGNAGGNGGAAQDATPGGAGGAAGAAGSPGSHGSGGGGGGGDGASTTNAGGLGGAGVGWVQTSNSAIAGPGGGAGGSGGSSVANGVVGGLYGGGGSGSGNASGGAGGSGGNGILVVTYAAAGSTANYGWVKPMVGASVDAWGGYINTDLDGIDSTVKSVSNAIPLASSTTPAMDGTATIGTGTTFARADHIHPSDTSRYAASNPSGYQTAAQVTAAVPAASSTTPVMDGTAATGTGTTWARADHVHPSDTSKLGVQGTTTNNNANAGAIGEVIASNVVAPGVTLATGAATNITTIALTAGDWDVYGEVWTVSGTGIPTAVGGAISATSATLPFASSLTTAMWLFASTALAASSTSVFALRPCRVSLAAPATYYLLGYMTFPSGTCTAYGNIIARRAR